MILIFSHSHMACNYSGFLPKSNETNSAHFVSSKIAMEAYFFPHFISRDPTTENRTWRGGKIVQCFLKYKNEILCFAMRSEALFGNNNRIESDILMAKVRQKSQTQIQTPITLKLTAEIQAACSRCRFRLQLARRHAIHPEQR